ncbi:MAG: Asp-tRNA(Asn)/Glu-tRNA(Gln) amidotransferase subunit GatB [Hydrogenophaga sp.]|uniref:Asp-tRNA(Asn)/Glu-tRNA(Gln) amidotransferase subunit GatB n=1 Tax=Hydrogenophaga sp. TaxID=1904254 RepID=UPI001D3A3A3C|nr:Asp-tRNA(Asn)/Glu-tRNA(Gln) amidotransferase subunit GatB [Hydrogenophaga sp.]MBX3611697.1 Asp-tRNA(Asn)/Glu-tRNA(Gln) amidotransferase subunit GatB [Hydrogenophaga sp.]
MTTATKTDFEPVIGLEVHVQLKTRSKMLCGCAVQFGSPANSLTCPVCLGLPGALPMVNRLAVEYGIRVGLALNCQIAHRVKFDRKNYFYPDLPKGYQISQYDEPLCFDGELQLPLMDQAGNPKICRITRAHLEEDAGKSIHMETGTLVDLNRAGTPLIEIVGGPDLRSPEEAYVYLTTLKRNLSYLGVSDLSMEKGSLRCDANVSIRPRGQENFDVRSEIKNLNSFRFMQQAIDYEVRWQIEQIEDGHAIQQATVLFDPDTGETRAMRTKEDAADYRYFPDPDLPPLVISRDWVAEVEAAMPELPRAMADRFVQQYGLPEYDATTLTQSPAMAAYFEAAARDSGQAKMASNWVMGEVSRRLNSEERDIAEVPVDAPQLAALLKRIADGTVSNNAAKQVMDALWKGEGSDVDAVIDAKGLKQVSDSGAIEKIIDEVMAANADMVAQFRAGKDKAFNALVGQVMKASKGKANPQQVNDLLRAKLG